ncbi:RNA 3'-terminal phosphate cyclase [Salinirubrum litoreum]|uniref:RNA 3'-terminal phosphate cyclase n=1 Tax=Salinirubrum litoreum TaxID=1126234 RepID=A0ABD5REW2_9EURY|nr:RNA 3'-terminal phosphate cyclase [Salinirubrum litoreum]
MLELDGAAGGGQQLRTALSLSLVTGEAFRMTDVRANRPNPGLKHQHRGAVRLAGEIGDADVTGDDVGTTAVEFAPETVASDPVEIDLQTAGSVTLLFDVVLPLAVALDESLTVTAHGGTDVAWSPTADFLRHAKLPLLAEHGLDADLSVARRGFYPAGGGEATLTVHPSDPSPLDLTDRGPVDSVAVYSVASESLADPEVAERQADTAVEALGESAPDLAVAEPRIGYDETASPGSAIAVVADCAPGRAGFDALGEKGVPAEQIAERAVEPLLAWLDGGPERAHAPPVDTHLADQLLVPLALAGGAVRVPRVTDHVRTNCETIRAFGFEVSVAEADDGTAVVSAPR